MGLARLDIPRMLPRRILQLTQPRVDEAQVGRRPCPPAERWVSSRACFEALAALRHPTFSERGLALVPAPFDVLAAVSQAHVRAAAPGPA